LPPAVPLLHRSDVVQWCSQAEVPKLPPRPVSEEELKLQTAIDKVADKIGKLNSKIDLIDEAMDTLRADKEGDWLAAVADLREERKELLQRLVPLQEERKQLREKELALLKLDNRAQ
jgi:uncharacterized coiled-coil DUF342 family protein